MTTVTNNGSIAQDAEPNSDVWQNCSPVNFAADALNALAAIEQLGYFLIKYDFEDEYCAPLELLRCRIVTDIWDQ